MAADRTGTFRGDGADFYHVVRGAGPPLMLLPSGGGDAHAADLLATRLAETHTVLTYDRRGQTRTTVDDPGRPVSLERHAEDAGALADHVFGAAPVDVFGCSTGAVIGLELAWRRPQRVSVLVAHESPLRSLATASERAEYDRLHRDARRVHAESGWQAALRVLRAGFGDPSHDPRDREDEVVWEPPSSRTVANINAFLTGEARATWEYQVSAAGWAALRTGAPTIVPATGRETDTFPSRSAARLAAVLGVHLADLPGGHEGYRTHPAAFGAALRALLTSARATG
ncbi:MULTISPECIES: alpha/beta fold hydrolase [Micromonospora]|uniref:Pimeloyl-ACP methyl ester carboxylesterase n=1 Tax=Micromonospora yangpuensis TaxID=683228 RepID=A0A1C6VID0_9ACTN|nr:alpha/beta hydrolase [Micromonospora yangpuensis]GGL99813.1 alpha/beta hydrolase [Micromonospora yangpuensis]SCL65814.1 Pimeloyl-ACP methyl ester carboxylesterase [Micromonospora yangpuensis]